MKLAIKYIKNKNGFTLIELVVTMVILGILGATVTGLVQTGLSSYGNIKDNMAYETEARTALSLITIQIRQHDETKAITYNAARNRLELKDDADHTAGAVIWFEDKTVYIQQVSNVADFVSPADATAVAEVYGLLISQGIADDGITNEYTITITYGPSGEKTLTQSIAQRSEATD